MRWSTGLDFAADDYNTIGAYYQSSEKFTFEDAVVLQPLIGPIGSIPIDVPLELPQNLGVGWSNNRLMGGKLLIAADVVYKLWGEATMFENIYQNQLVVQTGAQYTGRRAKYRVGYAWNDKLMREIVGNSAGGILPAGGANAIQFVQGQVAAIGRHQISAGIGVPDVLPGIDLNLFGGGMLRESQQFGLTATTLQSYFAGFGLTWRFNRGACGCDIAPNNW